MNLRLPAFRDAYSRRSKGTTARLPAALNAAAPAIPHLHTHTRVKDGNTQLENQKTWQWINECDEKRWFVCVICANALLLLLWMIYLSLNILSSASSWVSCGLQKHLSTEASRTRPQSAGMHLARDCSLRMKVFSTKRPLTTKLNEKRHLKGTFLNTKGHQRKEPSAVSSTFHL